MEMYLLEVINCVSVFVNYIVLRESNLSITTWLISNWLKPAIPIAKFCLHNLCAKVRKSLFYNNPDGNALGKGVGKREY